MRMVAAAGEMISMVAFNRTTGNRSSEHARCRSSHGGHLCDLATHRLKKAPGVELRSASSNPDDGGTYKIKMELRSDDVIVARVYLGVPLFGKTRTLVRVPMGTSAGWC